MTKFTKIEKRIIAFSIMIAAMFATSQTAYGMHIMEGYLPAVHCIVWGAISIPFLFAGVIGIRHTVQEKHRTLILLAMSGAYIFVLSSLKIPSVTGSCSHMTGTGLSAIIFGPMATSVLGIIVLLFQAILLAHGGLTTLGANTFSMAIAGPLFSILLYKIGNRLNLSRKTNIFIAAALGDLFTYCVTSMQLALAYPSETGGVAASALKFLAVFAPTQVPLAIIEGILTVIIIMGMESFAAPELKEIGFKMEVN